MLCLVGQQAQRHEAQGGRAWCAECGVRVCQGSARMEDMTGPVTEPQIIAYSPKTQSADFLCKAMCFYLFYFCFTLTFKPETPDRSSAPAKL